MNKEDLKAYKEMLSHMSEEELKDRDNYLRDLANGVIQGPQVGYPSIDKPWFRYFDESTLKLSKKTVYQELVDNNQSNLDDVALEYFGSKITFRKFIKNIDETAKHFVKLGIKKGDFITICAAGMPETLYSFYAASKIGAVSTMISPFFDQSQLINRVEDCKSDVIVIMDGFYDQMKEAIQNARFKKIIVVPTMNSSILRYITPKYKLEKNDREILWNDFMKENVQDVNVEVSGYEENMPLAMVFSSGTTGASKGILLSNDSFQNSLSGYNISGVEIHSGQKFYQIIPPWFSTGLSTSIHLPLTHGCCVFMDPRFERKVFIKNIIKHKPNYAIAPTSMYEGFLDPVLLKNRDLSFFKYPFEGGEPLKREVSDKIEKVFREHNSDANLLVGYGQCECGATITTETSNTTHENGTVGIPLPGIVVSIMDKDRNELPYNVRGEICVDTPCSMLEYFKNPSATSEYFFCDGFGHKYNCTGDIGYMDENGNLFIQGRASDFTKIGDEEVYNFDIENIIMNIPGVKIVDVLDKNGYVSDTFVVHLVLEDEYKNSPDKINEVFLNIQQAIYDHYQNIDYVPNIFKVRDSFPYAKSGKRNTLEMREESDGFVKFGGLTVNIKKLVK